MGLEPRPLTEWLTLYPDDAAVLAERDHLIRTKPDEVLAALPHSFDAVVEGAGVLEAHGFAGLPRTGDTAAMAAIGRRVAEDICILTAGDDGYRLTAAVLCFPNRWRLVEKIGRDLLAVHGPVPDYPGALKDAVERFLVRLRPMRPFMRENWGFASRPDRHLPAPIPPVDIEQGDAFFLRTERQSFLKLPETQAVIFSIRTTIVPWAEVPESRRAALKTAVAALSPAWLAYKSIVRRP